MKQVNNNKVEPIDANDQKILLKTTTATNTSRLQTPRCNNTDDGNDNDKCSMKRNNAVHKTEHKTLERFEIGFEEEGK